MHIIIASVFLERLTLFLRTLDQAKEKILQDFALETGLLRVSSSVSSGILIDYFSGLYRRFLGIRMVQNDCPNLVPHPCYTCPALICVHGIACRAVFSRIITHCDISRSESWARIYFSSAASDYSDERTKEYVRKNDVGSVPAMIITDSGPGHGIIHSF